MNSVFVNEAEVQKRQREEVEQRVILALDSTDRMEIAALAKQFGPRIGGINISSSVMAAELGSFCRKMFAESAQGRPLIYMADANIVETPKSAARTARVLAEQGYQFITLYAECGVEAMRLAQAAVVSVNPSATLLVSIVLTSMCAEDLARVGTRVEHIRDLVYARARAAESAGVGGAVCSGRDIELLKKHLPKFLLIVPGIRLYAPAEDQKRYVLPAEAMRLGADYLDIGSEITEAADPEYAFTRVVEEMRRGRFPGT
ncbi:orotidine 5'-phosphate decarboxylase [Patescibacteria group bacterium]|nr:orotidine 5'-phosphate decarboxylase [Patescibacteria group bacterium]